MASIMLPLWFASYGNRIRVIIFMGTITLWTRQVPQVLTTLPEDGVYRCKEEYIRQKNDTIGGPF